MASLVFLVISESNPLVVQDLPRNGVLDLINGFSLSEEMEQRLFVSQADQSGA